MTIGSVNGRANVSSGPQKAYFEVEDQPGLQISCMFNPAELKFSRSNTWDSGVGVGGDHQQPHFQGEQPATLSLQLTYDTTRDGEDVTKYTNKFDKLAKIDKNLKTHDPQRDSGRPPWVRLRWGSMSTFKMIIVSISTDYTYFSDGVPRRARISLVFQEWQGEDLLPLQNPTSFTPDVHTVHTLLPGESLDRVAANHLHDPTQWRLIAEANGVVDPLDIAAGSSLVIPKPGVRYRG